LLKKQSEVQGKVLRFGNYPIEEEYIKKITPKIFKIILIIMFCQKKTGTSINPYQKDMVVI